MDGIVRTGFWDVDGLARIGFWLVVVDINVLAIMDCCLVLTGGDGLIRISCHLVLADGDGLVRRVPFGCIWSCKDGFWVDLLPSLVGVFGGLLLSVVW